MSEIYSETIFVDSGAHGLYNLFVLEHAKRIGKNGRELARPKVPWTQGKFTYYDLRPGSVFRSYCDSYARFIKKIHSIDSTVIMANIDAISNPKITWEIQQYFEKEHGVTPVPIIHYDTPLRFVDRYVGGKYWLLGVGGLGQGVSRHEYFKWGDTFFSHICPESNKFKPVIRTHGFAMTSWELICRYPWWSVDSATWVKLSAYGWLYVPRWSERKGFRFDKTPMMINFSVRPPKKKIRKYPGLGLVDDTDSAPREKERGKHFKNIEPSAREGVLKWLEHVGVEMGSVDENGDMLTFGVSSHHRARSMANLAYLKDLEASRPEWPYPLDLSEVSVLPGTIQSTNGLGFEGLKITSK